VKQGRLILINILILVAVIIVGGLGMYYWNQNYNYVTTEDASVTAPTIPVPALAAGTIQICAASGPTCDQRASCRPRTDSEHANVCDG